MEYDLIIFDLDGTISPMNQDVLYADFIQWLADHPEQPWCVASNQGGCGLKFWMEHDSFGTPEKWPSVDTFNLRVTALFGSMARMPLVLRCYRYQSRTSGKWSPVPVGCEEQPEWSMEWRKPAPGMLLRAMEIAQVLPIKTLMVGDSTDDYGAATAAMCQFMPERQFFGRQKPDEGLR